MISLKRIIPKGLNLFHKSVVRFKSTTSAESSSHRNEELNLKEVLNNIVSIVTNQSSKDVTNLVVIWTGLAGAFFIAWEFFSIGQIRVEIAGIRLDFAQHQKRTDKLFEIFMNQTTDNHKQFAQHQQQFAHLVKENAEASKKADERYFEVLNAIKK